MLVDEKEAKQDEEGKTEVKASSLEPLIKLDEAATEANVDIAEDQELKVLPANDEEEEKIVEVEDANISSLTP
jgi:hypothetical protein